MEALLKALDIPYKRHGYNLTALCPSPDHNDSKPSWTIVDRPGSAKHGGHKCWSCGFRGGPWELVIAVRGVDEDGAADFVKAIVTGKPREFAGVPTVRVRVPPPAAYEYCLPPGVCIPSLDGSEWPDVFADYLERRGVTAEQIIQWHIGFATRGPLAWRVVIPVHTRGRLVAHVARAVFDDRERYDMPTRRGRNVRNAQPEAALFGEPLLDPTFPVLTIAEGSFSKLALDRAGAPNTVALLGSDWSAEKAAILTVMPWQHVIVATDPDDAGDRVARSISMNFRSKKISRIRLGESPDDCELVLLRDAVHSALASHALPGFAHTGDA